MIVSSTAQHLLVIWVGVTSIAYLMLLLDMPDGLAIILPGIRYLVLDVDHAVVSRPANIAPIGVRISSTPSPIDLGLFQHL